MSIVVSIRIPNKRTWEKAKEYAKKNGLTIGNLVIKALEYYMNREDRILNQIKTLEKRLEAIEKTMKRVKVEEMKEETTPIEIEETELPSFMQNNPWIKILSERDK